MPNFTAYHAKYLAYELTRRHASDSVEKLAPVLAEAQVDLNPHQVEAALFAFRNPFSRGAILADEVGLGKTIEAGLLLAQKWAERQRHLLVIVPANLRKQWSQELEEKFHLPTVILERRSFDEAIRNGNLNPFNQEKIVICSFQFVRSRAPYVQQVSWGLVVVDEAHRLRNVYKPSSKIARGIQGAIANFPKVLLTATPLQNSLLELYGLVSLIDPYAFGDLGSYKSRFARLGNEADFGELKARLRPLCKRTLRRQVLEYIKYTNRHALVQEFTPHEDEQRLYDLVSEYLQRPSLFALPASQRQLVTLILRKLLASSSRAISHTLAGLVERVAAMEREATAAADPVVSDDDWEELDEWVDEWEDDEETSDNGRPSPKTRAPLSAAEREALRAELAELRRMSELAQQIARNAKGEVLLTALRRGFEAAKNAQKEKGAPTLQQKAIIFTESRKTQSYLWEILSQTEFAGRVVLFNGANNDPLSKKIYKDWAAKYDGTERVTGSATADMRAALVEHFRDEATILIATEAAAEGINLQFCNLVVNYDLPWNPQRIEQRIGRCHRYGQQYDVVVVNFLNKKNAADVRVYQLLDEKFKLFDGVFGASDEVLGAVEAGVDFEKRIAAIYQQCRTAEQIQREFDQLQSELEAEIAASQQDAREKLLDNFDQEVVERVRILSHDFVDKFQQQLWALSRFVLAGYADFAADRYEFTLHTNPLKPQEKIPPARLGMGKAHTAPHSYRLDHVLAQWVLAQGKTAATPPAALRFAYTASGKRLAVLDGLVGHSGWLLLTHVAVAGLETEDALLWVGLTADGQPLEPAACQRLFDVPAEVQADGKAVQPPPAILHQLTMAHRQQEQALLADLTARDGHWFDREMEKLDYWVEDRRATLKAELDKLEEAVKEARKAAKQAGTIPEKVALQQQVTKLGNKRDEAWRKYEQEKEAVEGERDNLLDDISKRLQQKTESVVLMLVRWEVV